MRKNIIERTGYKSEALKLAANGITYEEIAEKLNEWDEGRSGVSFTPKQVHGFIQRTLGAGNSKAIELQRMKDAIELSALAKGKLEMFRQDVQIANASGDMRRLKLASENLLAWYDRNAELQGLTGKHAMEINVNVGAQQREVDALKRAITEIMADFPDAWPKIMERAKYYTDNPDSKGVIDVVA